MECPSSATRMGCILASAQRPLTRCHSLLAHKFHSLHSKFQKSSVYEKFATNKSVCTRRNANIYIFVCITIHSTCVARSACLKNKTGKHKQLTIPIAEGRCISFFFFEPVQQVPPLQHRREELDQIFVAF